MDRAIQKKSENEVMVFATVTKKAPIFGRGNCIDKDRFEISRGVKMFFYDRETIREEFGRAGLFEIVDVNDVYPSYLIKCKKKTNIDH